MSSDRVLVGAGATAVSPSTGPLRVAAAPMAVVTVVLLAVASRYGPHWDELYFRTLPLRWWYVDQPPLTVWLAWLCARISDEIWVQRLPAIVAAAAGVFVAGLFPRLLGAGVRTQRLAAWAHAFTVHPLIMGHIMTTATFDLLAWQVIILLVLRAQMGSARCLVWAGTVAGLACWNKLLVAVLVVALLLSVLLTDRSLLRSRHALTGAVLFGAIAAPQALAQITAGLPMADVASGLVAEQGGLVRLVLLPALALFAGPPLILVWLMGLVEPWLSPGRPGRFLLPTLVLLVVWTLASPSQPYYPMGVVLPALSLGWASTRLRRRWGPSKRSAIVVANSLVASVLSLPLLPAGEPWRTLQATVNPTIRDQIGWPDYAAQVWAAHRDGEDIVVDTHSLAGAVQLHRPPTTHGVVASGHNGLWTAGRPHSDRVLLVGEHAVAQQELFATCSPVGTLQTARVIHPQINNAPMERCSSPVADWSTLWPRFRRVTG